MLVVIDIKAYRNDYNVPVPYMDLRNFIKTVPLVLQVYFHIISYNKENICNSINEWL